MSVVDKGGAIIINENEEMTENLLINIKDLIKNPDKIRKMEIGSEEASRPSALDTIVDNIF